MAADLAVLLPELLLVATVVAVLLADVIWRRDASRGTVLLALAGVGLAAAAVALFLVPVPEARLVFGMVAVDRFSVFFRWLFLLSALLAVAFVGRSDEIPARRTAEYLALILSIAVGLCLLASAQHLLLLYLALELVSVPSYVLAGFRHGDRRSSEAALKYVIYGGVASGVMLYGLSWLYGLTGTLDLAEISHRVGDLRQAGWDTRLLLTVAALGSLAGFGYKVAAVPFHMWCPDVYEGAPTPFVAFLSVAPKAAGLAALFRFVVVGFGGAVTWPVGEDFPWPLLLGLLSMVTMTLGNLVAIVQTNLKRLLAYSSIAHAGYMLMGIAVATPEGSQAVMFYLAVYLCMNFGAFLAVMAVRNQTGSENIADYRGFGSTSPLLAVTLAVFLFSLTGLPPFAGFIGKFYLFAAVLNTGEPFFYAVALVGALNSAVSLYYYARVIRVMYLDPPLPDAPAFPLRAADALLLTALAAPMLILGVWWGPLASAVAESTGLLR